jgi:ABC-type glycerol-3-phosphate transport system permease component
MQGLVVWKMNEKFMKNCNLRKTPVIVLRQLIMIFITVSSIFPLYFMFINSIKTKEEYVVNKLSIPLKYTFANFINIVIDKNIARGLFNSIILTVGSVLLVTVLSALAAYALSKMKVPFKKGIMNIVVSLMVFPPAVMIIPMFVFFVSIRLINNFVSPILIYTGLMMPFSIFLLYSFFNNIPHELIEAAKIDGCSNIRIFSRIIIPISKPALITLIVVNSLWVWNELLIALIFLQKDSLKPLMVLVTLFRSRFSTDIPLTMAGLVIATIPMLLLYFFGQGFFQKGLIAGALKE